MTEGREGGRPKFSCRRNFRSPFFSQRRRGRGRVISFSVEKKEGTSRRIYSRRQPYVPEKFPRDRGKK